ncbi:HEPN domain-containing protein [Nanoarchaeota archaeon]
MDSKVKLFLERAENELRLAKAIFNLSNNEEIKIQLEANPNDTFYSASISHAYYTIFYSAKSLLLTKGIDTKSPSVHKKTFEEFQKHFVDTGKLDISLLQIYKKMIVKADELLGLFSHEKWKRGHFTYHTIAQANIEPAKESYDNAKKFLVNIKEVINF